MLDWDRSRRTQVIRICDCSYFKFASRKDSTFEHMCSHGSHGSQWILDHLMSNDQITLDRGWSSLVYGGSSWAATIGTPRSTAHMHIMNDVHSWIDDLMDTWLMLSPVIEHWTRLGCGGSCSNLRSAKLEVQFFFYGIGVLFPMVCAWDWRIYGGIQERMQMSSNFSSWRQEI